MFGFKIHLPSLSFQSPHRASAYFMLLYTFNCLTQDHILAGSEGKHLPYIDTILGCVKMHSSNLTVQICAHNSTLHTVCLTPTARYCTNPGLHQNTPSKLALQLCHTALKTLLYTFVCLTLDHTLAGREGRHLPGTAPSLRKLQRSPPPSHSTLLDLKTDVTQSHACFHDLCNPQTNLHTCCTEHRFPHYQATHCPAIQSG